MADNFEHSGIILELKGIEAYLAQLVEMARQQAAVAESAGTLSNTLNGLDTLVTTVFGNINKIQINADHLGFLEIGQQADKSGQEVKNFGDEVSQGLSALKKITDIGADLGSFKTVTEALVADLSLLQSGFNNIQDVLNKLELGALARQADATAKSVTSLADAFKLLKTALNTKIIDTLDRLIPILISAGSIGKLGNVGVGIGAIINGLKKLDKIPDLASKKNDLTALVEFLDKMAKLNIPTSIGTGLADVADGLEKLRPALAGLAKINLTQSLNDNLQNLLLTFSRFSNLDTTKLISLGDALGKLSSGIRAIGGGEAGKNFTSNAVGIAVGIKELLTALADFSNLPNVTGIIQIVGDLGIAIKGFAKGTAALGGKSFQNIPLSVTNIIDALHNLQTAFDGFVDLNGFIVQLDSVSKAIGALSKAFSSIGRSKSITDAAHLQTAIKNVIQVLKDLSQDDVLAAAQNVEKLVAPITAFANSLKLLKGQSLSSGLVNNITSLSGSFSGFNNLVNVFLQNIGKVIVALGNFAKSIGGFALNAVVQGFLALGRALLVVGEFLIKLPVQAVVLGFKAIEAAANFVLIPFRLLVTAIEALSSAFGKLFGRGKANIGDQLGVNSAEKDITKFNSELNNLNSGFAKNQTSSKDAAGTMNSFSESTGKAEVNVAQLTGEISTLNERGSLLNRIFGSNELLQVAGTFKAVDVAVNLAQNAIFSLTQGIGSLIGEAVKSASDFEQLNLQLVSLQAKEAVKNNIFPDVPTALNKGIDFLNTKVDGLINQFRILAIQSPFETSDITNAFKMAQAFGFDTDAAKELVTTLTDAGTALGFSGADLTEVTRVFGQIHTAGKLQAQDLNQLAQRGIGVKQMFNDLTGTEIDFAHTTINADDAIHTIVRSLQHDFAGAAARSADSITGLVGSFASFRDESLRTFIQPIVDGLRPLFVGLADTLFKPEIFDKIQAAGDKAFAILEKIILSISSIAGVISNIFAAIPQPFKDFFVLLGKAALASIAFTTAIIGLQVGFALLSAALIFILNPLGQIAIVTVLVSAGLEALTSDTMNAVQSLITLGKIAVNAFNFKDALTQLSLIVQLPKPIQDAALALANLSASFSRFVDVVKLIGTIFIQAFAVSPVFGPILDNIGRLDTSLQGLGFQVASAGVFFRGLFNNLVTFASGIQANVISALDSLGSSVVNVFNNILQTAGSAVNGLFTLANNTATFFSGLIQDVADFGSGVVSAFAGGMQDAVNLVVEAVNAIADAITYLLAPGSPPRALPDIDKWGTAAAQEFIDGMAVADVGSLDGLSTSIETAIGTFQIPDGVGITDFFKSLNFTTDDAGNIVDSLGNIVLTQEQLAQASKDAANQLSDVNAQLAALDKQASIQKQQNIVDTIKAALKQPGLSTAAKQVLQQQLTRAELELKRLQLQDQSATSKTGSGFGGGSGSGSKKDKTKKEKAAKEVKEPDQKLPKVVKPKKGKKGKESLDLPDVADTIAKQFDQVSKGNGILGKIQKTFDDAKNNIAGSIGSIRDTIVGKFNEIKAALIGFYNSIKPILDQIAQVFQGTFGKLQNQGPIVGIIGGLATAIGRAAGWNTLAIIAGGITALGLAWSVASGQVTLDLPDNLQALQDQIDKMRAGFKGAAPQTTFLPGIGKIQTKGKSLAETIMGFSISDFSTSLGALLEALGASVGTFFTTLDTAITNASTANQTGNNPVLAFLDTFFNTEKIRQKIVTEASALGTVIKDALSGQLQTATSTSDVLRENHSGTGSVIADFIINQVKDAASIVTNFDVAGQFAKFKTDLANIVNGILNPTSANGQPSTTNPVIAQLSDFVTRIGDIVSKTTNWTQFTKDLSELGKSLAQFVNLSVPIGLTILVSTIAGVISTVSELPQIAQSSIQVINDAILTIENLAKAVIGIKSGDFNSASIALHDAVVSFLGIFKEFSDIDKGIADIISTFIDSISRIIGAVSGVKDPEAFKNSIAPITSVVKILGDALVNLAEAQFLASLPQIIKLNGNMPLMVSSIVIIGTVADAIENFNKDHPSTTTDNIVNFLNSVKSLLFAVTAVNALSGGGVIKLFAGLQEIFSIFTLTKLGLPTTAATTGLGKIFVWITGTLAPFIKGGFSTVVTALGAIDFGAIASIGSVVLVAVGIIASVVDAFVNDFGGIKTDALINLQGGLDALGKIIDGISKRFGKDRTAGIQEANQGWEELFVFGLKFNQFSQFGTNDNFKLILATYQGFFDLIDKIFGSHLADKWGKSIQPIFDFFNKGGTVSDLGVITVQHAIDQLFRLTGLDSTPVNKFVIAILGIVDAFRRFALIQLDKVVLAVQIFNTVLDLINHPFNAGSDIPVISGLLEQFNKLQQPMEKMTSFAQEYKDWIDQLNKPQTASPAIQFNPHIEGATQSLQKNGKFSSLLDIGKILGVDTTSTGATGEGIQVPVTVSPQVSIDQTPIDTAFASLTTTTQTTFTGLETTVNTSISTIANTVNTSFPAIATSISNAATVGSAGFISELGKVPQETVKPKDDIIAQLDGYAKDFNQSGLGLGEDFASGFKQGINGKTQEVVNASTTFASLAIHSVKQTIQSASPSKVMYKEGQNFGDGFWLGIGATRNKVLKGATELGKSAIKGITDTIAKGQGAIAKTVQSVIGGIFENKGLKLDFSKWEIVSDSETDVKKRAKDSATNVAEQFGNEFARVTNQVFDELISNDPSLAPDFFNTEDINKSFDDQINAIFKHRDDTLSQLNSEGKKEFDRNFLAAFTDPQGLKKIADDFIQQFSDEDLMNLPKVYGAVDKFVAGLRDRLTKQANAGDGFATSMLGGLDKLDQALNDELQAAIDSATSQTNGSDTATAASSVGSSISENVASGTVSPESLGGLQGAVDTLTGVLVTAVQTGFATITATVTTEGANSATGFITGIDVLNTNLPDEITKIIGTLNSSAKDFTDTGTTLGEDFAGGYIDGILNKIKELTDAVNAMVNAAKNAAAAAQNSHSPSKDMILEGQNFGEGFAIGIANTQSEVVKASAALIKAATTTASTTVTKNAPILSKNLQDAVTQGTFFIDENVKVTPPVDSNQVDKATESMNKLQAATEQAKSIFDNLGTSFHDTFNDIVDKFLTSNPDAISNIWNIHDIRAAAESAGGELRDSIDNIAKELTPNGRSKFTDVIKGIFGDKDTVSTLVQSFIDSFAPEDLVKLQDSSGAIDTFIAKLKDALDDGDGFLKKAGLSGDLLAAFKGLGSTLKTEIQKTIDEIQNPEAEVPTTPSWITDLFGTPSDLTQVGQDTGAALAEGVAVGASSQQALASIATAAQQAIDQYITELQNSGQIHSPSKLTMKLAGEPLVDGMIVGMRNRFPDVIKTAAHIGDTVANSFGGDWLQQNTLDQNVNLKYNGLVNSLPELFQNVNGKIINGASRLKGDIMQSGNSNARTGMLTNYSVVHNNNTTQDQYHLHMDVSENQLPKVRRGFRVARQLGIN